MDFADRRDAGRRLASALRARADGAPVVVGLPRGGMVVAAEVARALGAPLDLLVVRKLGAPDNAEYAVGAIAEDGTCVLDADAARRTGMSRRTLEATMNAEEAELRRRVAAYRGGRAPVDLRGRVALVVDDGLATGLTALVAVRAIRSRGAAQVVLAVPVGSPEAIAMLEDEADEVICLSAPDHLVSVGSWYRGFRPVSDAEVVDALTDVGAVPAVSELVRRPLRWRVGTATIEGQLALPPDPRGLVLFAHGSGSSRHSPRNHAVATVLRRAGLGTILFDLLTDAEAAVRERVFDIRLLAERLEAVAAWAIDDDATSPLRLGLFGASTGAAAALRVAGEMGDAIAAVVSRGGRPDLAAGRLAAVTAPTLLIVGGRDAEVLELNRRAAEELTAPCRIAVVPGAGHLFEEPGALDAVARLAADWFTSYLSAEAPLAGAGETHA